MLAAATLRSLSNDKLILPCYANQASTHRATGLTQLDSESFMRFINTSLQMPYQYRGLFRCSLCKLSKSISTTLQMKNYKYQQHPVADKQRQVSWSVKSLNSAPKWRKGQEKEFIQTVVQPWWVETGEVGQFIDSF